MKKKMEGSLAPHQDLPLFLEKGSIKEESWAQSHTPGGKAEKTPLRSLIGLSCGGRRKKKKAKKKGGEEQEGGKKEENANAFF